MTESELQSLLASLRRTPDDAAALARRVPEPALRTRPAPDAFSALENVWHLRDIETEGFLVRIEKLIAEANPTLPDIDGAKLAIERRYNERDLEEGLAQFRAAREAGLAAVEAVGAAKLDAAGVQEGVGPVTLESLLRQMRDHDRGHLAEMEGLLRT